MNSLIKRDNKNIPRQLVIELVLEFEALVGRLEVSFQQDLGLRLALQQQLGFPQEARQRHRVGPSVPSYQHCTPRVSFNKLTLPNCNLAVLYSQCYL